MPYHRATESLDNWFARFVLQQFQASDINPDAVVTEEDCAKQRAEVIARKIGLLFGVSGEELEQSERRLLKLRLCERDAVINVAHYSIKIHSNLFRLILDILEMDRELIKLHSEDAGERTKMTNSIIDMVSTSTQNANDRSRKHLDDVQAYLLKTIEHKFDEVGQKFDAMDQKMDQKFDAMDQKTDQKFDAMDQKFDAMDQKMDQKFDAMDQKLYAMDQKMDQKFDAMDRKMDQRLDAMDQKFDAMDQKFNAVDQKFNAVDRKIDSLETKMNGMCAMLTEILERLPPRTLP